MFRAKREKRDQSKTEFDSKIGSVLSPKFVRDRKIFLIIAIVCFSLASLLALKNIVPSAVEAPISTTSTTQETIAEENPAIPYHSVENDPGVESSITASHMFGKDLVVEYSSAAEPRLEGMASDRYRIEDGRIVIYDYGNEYFRLVFGKASDVYEFGIKAIEKGVIGEFDSSTVASLTGPSIIFEETIQTSTESNPVEFAQLISQNSISVCGISDPVAIVNSNYVRGKDYSIVKNPDGTCTWTSASAWVSDGSKYVPYYYEDHYKGKGYYLVCNGRICAEIYDDYSRFFDVEHKEVRVGNETWVVEEWTGREWKDLGYYNPTFEINENKSANSISITKTARTRKGVLNITFLFREGAPMKHDVKWTASERATVRVNQRWSNVKAEGVIASGVDKNITDTTEIYSTDFTFYARDNPFIVHESQWSTGYIDEKGVYHNEVLQPTVVGVDNEGLKVNYVFGNWTLAQGESLTVDPDTTTLNNPAEDGDIDSYSGSYTKSITGGQYIRAGSFYIHYYRSYIEWNVFSIPDAATITNTVFKYHGYMHNVDCHVHEMLGTRPATSAALAVWTEIGEGTVYVDPAGFPVVGTNQQVDLGASADTDLQNSLASDWFAIGIQADDEAIIHSAIMTEYYPSVIPPPTLYVVYTVPAPTLTSVSESTDPIQEGTTQTITPSGQGDPESDALHIYCCQDTTNTCAPTTANTCINDQAWSSPYSSMTCTLTAPDVSSATTYYARCRVYDGALYSSTTASTSYTIVTKTAPTLTGVSKSTDPIQEGATQTITPSGQGDPESDALHIYCCQDTTNTCAPTTANTCINDQAWSSPYTSMTCTLTAPAVSSATTYYARCVLYDGALYSSTMATATLNDPVEDGHIVYSGTYFRINSPPHIYLGRSSSTYTYRGYVEWDTTSIPDSATITNTVFKYRGYSHAIDCHIHDMLDTRPSTSTDSSVYSKAGSGTVYADPAGFPVVGANQQVDLGTTADTDLKNSLAADWFAIGIQPDNEVSDYLSLIYSEDNTGATSKPTLYVEYTFPAYPVPSTSYTVKQSDGDTCTADANCFSGKCDTNDFGKCFSCASCSGVTRCSNQESNECEAQCSGVSSACDDMTVDTCSGTSYYCGDCVQTTCSDNKCYEPTCTNGVGCGQSPVGSGQTDEACTGSTGCTEANNCVCDGSGNCKTATTTTTTTTTLPPSISFTSFSFSTKTNQLNVNWFTEYSGGTSVSVECKLNGAQVCSYVGMPGGGSCTISSPSYDTTPDPSGLPRTVANQLACTAYDTGNPNIKTDKIVNFYPRAIEASLPASMNPTVGDTQNLLITVKNNGTLTDSYTVSVTSTNPNLLKVTGGTQSTQSLDTNDVQQFYVGLTLLVSSQSTTANAVVRSNSQSAIQFSMSVSVKGTDKSLPEFDAFGVLQIIAMAALFASFLF